MAITCAVNEDLKEEWQKYLEQTKTHVAALRTVCEGMKIDAEQETPGRKVVRHVGGALVEAMKMALSAGDPAAAELVACECVVLAETKDHADWELITKCAEHLTGSSAKNPPKSLRPSRGRGGRTSLSHEGLVPGALAQVPRNESGSSASRGAAARENGHWRRAR